MIQKLYRFFRDYWQFGIALNALLIGIVLLLVGHATIAHWIIGIVSLILTVPLIIDMWRNLREGTYGIDILAATAIITAVVMHEYWAAIVVVLMLTGGEALEDYAENRAKTELDSLLTHAPQTARVIKSRGKMMEVPVSKVMLHDKLEIRPGEVVPVDAVIIEGDANFDESSLTGESLPQIKQAGDTILSGSINIDGAVIVKAVHTARDSQYQQIIKLVKAASANHSPFVRLADRYSIPFTVISFAIAGGAWAFSGDSLRFLQVLVVATPCPLILAAPIAIISGMSRAAKHGIIIRTGSALERLAEAKTIAFDKTGTLTEGNLIVTSVQGYEDVPSNEVLGIAAALEKSSNHVLAKAILEKANEARPKTVKAKYVKEIAGRGVSAVVAGKPVLVGRIGFMKENEVTMPASLRAAKQTVMYVARGGELIGEIGFADTIRKESKSTIERLRSSGIRHILMVTGDNKQTAETIAKKLGIDDVTAEALPADKLHTIEKLQQKPVAFVGDGVNDAPVLTAADVGIALGARGSTAASESADMVIMLDDVSRVAWAVDISKHTLKIAKQSIWVGIGISIVLMVVFATGRFKPLYGALLQEVVDVIVIFNALRAHGSFRKPGVGYRSSIRATSSLET